MVKENKTTDTTFEDLQEQIKKLNKKVKCKGRKT